MRGRRDEYDVAALERALEHAEHADAEVHKVYNNLGLAHTAAGRHRAALRAHRNEKQACKRLVNDSGGSASRLVDLAIAYRRCGDAMLKVDALAVGVDNDDGDDEDDARQSRTGAANTITTRVEIARHAYIQHQKALTTAAAARKAGSPAASVEVQAASAAMSQSALAIALETRERDDYTMVVAMCGRAAAMVEQLSDTDAVSSKARVEMTLSAAVNLAIAVSGLGDKPNAKKLFQAAGVRARNIGDRLNLIRCIANLAEEAGDEGDWMLCSEYVDEWVALAKKQRDTGEEADALRKRGAAMFERNKFEEARAALDRAALIGRDKSSREEALKNLHLVELELDEIRVAREKLQDVLPQVIAAYESGDMVEEARLRLTAGEAAVNLRVDDSPVFEHLSRYFVLVDEYGCSTMATGIDDVRHCTAVANMSEAYWRRGQFADAVNWGMRELAVYGDDIAGQAQAWCNIGIYLDDDGKFENALEALNKSIALAEEAGDEQLRSRAELNRNVVIANRAERNEQSNLGCDDSGVILGDCSARASGDADAIAGVSLGREESIESNHDDVEMPDVVTEAVSFPAVALPGVVSTSLGEQSIVMDSGGTNVAGGRGRYVDGGTVLSNAFPRRLSTGQSVETRSCGLGTGADRSSAGSRRYIDLPAEYRKRCKGLSMSGRIVEPRGMIMEKLRTVSAKLVTSDESETQTVDVSATFLTDKEFVSLFETLTALPVKEPTLSLNLRLNPLITPVSFRWLAGSGTGAASGSQRVSAMMLMPSIGPPRGLPSVVCLDLSGTGLDALSLGILARALDEKCGTLPSLATLSVGKNSLGDAPVAAADAVARLLTQSSSLRTLDLSLNLLPNNFLPLLADKVESFSSQREARTTTSGVCNVDFSLNNRRAPTALLETDGDSVVGYVRRLMRVVPSLQRLDLRACGAVADVRRALFAFRAELVDCRSQFEIVVVSPDVYDEAESCTVGAL
jgi:tetratricopeptide (TPR) repeat protein